MAGKEVAAEKWKKLTRKALDQLNIEDEYKRMGIKFPSNAKPKPDGWMACHAIGRDDQKASAAINVGDGAARGRYIDKGGDNDSLSFWDFAVKFGGYADWRTARDYFLGQCGLLKNKPKTEDAPPRERLSFVDGPLNHLMLRPLAKAYPGITTEAMALVGGRIARYPAKSPYPRYVLAVPVYGLHLLNSDPHAWVITPVDGRRLEIYRGEGNPVDREKRITVGTGGGLLGRLAFKHWETAELVWKVEGFSDLLALQSIIPEHLRDKHVVITNGGGAGEVGIVSESAPLFTGKKVVIVHDADVPGQKGAGLWVSVLKSVAASVLNFNLPYEVEEKHGKDLRDYLNEGHTYDDLLRILDLAPPDSAYVPESDHRPPVERPKDMEEVSPFDFVLDKMGIEVLGEMEGSSTIACYGRKTGKIADVKQISQIRIENLVQMFGDEVLEHIDRGNSPPGSKVSLFDIRLSIASAASRKAPIINASRVGMGAWPMPDGDCLALVGNRDVSIWNGSLHRTNIPVHQGTLFEFGGNDWINHDVLAQNLQASESEGWCRSAFAEAVELFSRWTNLKRANDPQILAALVLCSYVQSIWDWRPAVCIIGPSNSGKSMLTSITLPRIFGKLALACSSPSEAGLRQRVKNKSLVILIDEFENTIERSKIFQAMRSSSRGSEVLKGTTNQSGLAYGYRHIPWLSSIESGLTKAADLNRAIILELDKRPVGVPSLRVPTAEEGKVLGEKLLAVALRHWKRALRLERDLQKDKVSASDPRLVESYAVPASMIAAVTGMDAEWMAGFLNSTLTERTDQEQGETDEESLVNEIMGTQVRMARGHSATVIELLFAKAHQFEEDNVKVLERVGIKRIRMHGTGDGLFLVPDAVAGLLARESRFKGLKIRDILIRIRGAAAKQESFTIGNRPRGILIPMDSIRELVGDEVGGIWNTMV